MLSEDSHLALNSLLYPMNKLVSSNNSEDELNLSFNPVKEPPGVDIHLVTLTTLTLMNTLAAGLIVHRVNLDSCFLSHLPHLHQSRGMVCNIDMIIKFGLKSFSKNNQ